MKTKRRGQEGYVAVKLYMCKAHDRVEWDFLESMMWKLGFDGRWIQLVMLCITSAKYQFKVNGECRDVLIPQQVHRQGNPLSPYLFLLCVEVFLLC
jgi:hypothetical protein